MRHVVRKSVKDFDEADLEPAAEEKPQKSTERPKSKLAKGIEIYFTVVESIVYISRKKYSVLLQALVITSTGKRTKMV